MTCGPFYPAFFSTVNFDWPLYLGLNTTHISWSKKLAHPQSKRGRIKLANHYRWFGIRVHGSREYDVKPQLVHRIPLSPTHNVIFPTWPWPRIALLKLTLPWAASPWIWRRVLVRSKGYVTVQTKVIRQNTQNNIKLRWAGLEQNK